MKKIFITSTLFLLLLSCGENKQDKPIVENTVDNADSSVKSSFESIRNENMVYQIYDELIKTDKNLQALDEKIRITEEETEKATSQYDKVINKTKTYYENAKSLTKAISDSILKQEIETKIKTSSEKYDSKIKRIQDLISEVNKNSVKLHDQYVVFKIRKTLPEIEKYQNAHPLKTDSLENFIKKQNQLLNELKNLK